MRRITMLATPLLLLGVSGCVAPPPPGAYAYPGAYPGAYSQPAYQPGYPGAAYSDAGDIYPGYSYNAGAPSIVVEGASVPLIYYGGSWGYYDGYRRFHRAPESVWRHLETRHPGGYGVRPYAAAGYPDRRFEGGRPFGERGFERPPERARFEGRGFERPPEGPRGGFQPMPAGRFNGPPLAMPARPEGRPGFQHGGPPPAQGVSMAPPRQAPAAQAPAQHGGGGGGGHNCWPGQRC